MKILKAQVFHNKDVKSQEHCTPDFTNEKCELFSIDFEECQITLDVSDELLKSGLHAGTLTIDFTPLIQ